MQLREVMQIVRKHWILASIGFVLALGLSYLTYANRTPSPYTSTTTLLVTQKGYGFSNPTVGTSVIADGLVAYSYLYAQIAQGDGVRRAIEAPLKSITATVGTSSSGAGLPFIVLTGYGKSPGQAVGRAAAATRALQAYVRRGQRAAGIPRGARVYIQTLGAPSIPKQAATRKRVVMMPAIVFITVLLIFLGLTLMVENASRIPERAASQHRPYPDRATFGIGDASSNDPDRTQSSPILRRRIAQ